jgi:hypothetical protein
MSEYREYKVVADVDLELSFTVVERHPDHHYPVLADVLHLQLEGIKPQNTKESYQYFKNFLEKFYPFLVENIEPERYPEFDQFQEKSSLQDALEKFIISIATAPTKYHKDHNHRNELVSTTLQRLFTIPDATWVVRTSGMLCSEMKILNTEHYPVVLVQEKLLQSNANPGASRWIDVAYAEFRFPLFNE